MSEEGMNRKSEIMKVAAAAVSIIAVTLFAHSQETAKAPPLTVDELMQRPVIGELGLPLGTATEIQAGIVSGDSLNEKGFELLYLLNVTHVGGKKLDRPRMLEFSVPGFTGVKLANHTFGLYELKHGKKAGSLDSAQIKTLEQGYVGKTVRLVVYEVGDFSGVPHELPKDVPVWAGRTFHFSTSLVVLADRGKAQQ